MLTDPAIMTKHRIFVFAHLKPSQINYKIIPLSRSVMVDHVYVLRKTKLDLNNEKITCLSLPWILRLRPLYWFLTAIYGVFLIRKYKANIILNYNIFPHGFNAFLASKLTGLPAIFSEINEDTKNYYRLFMPRMLISSILRNAKFICVPGMQTASYWETRGYKKTYPLHSTIDTNRFRPDPGITKEFDFIYVGVFDRNKRPELILEAFAAILRSIPTAKLCMLGYGESEEELQERIRRLNITNSVEVVRTQNVLEYYHRSRIFIMASLSEGLPCAMMEAMACELITIVPPVGDIGDVIEDGTNGFLHNNSSEDLKKRMHETLVAYDTLTFMRTNARNTIINNHSYQFAVNRWNDLLSKI